MRRWLVVFLFVFFPLDVASPFTPGIFTFDGDDVTVIRHGSSRQTKDICVIPSSKACSFTGIQRPVARPRIHTAARETDDFVRGRHLTSGTPDNSPAPSEDH